VPERELQLKVTLLHTKPPVWRRLVVREAMTLHDLHQAIQLAIGWLDCHLYAFEIGRRSYTTLDDDASADNLDAETTVLADLRLARKGTRFRYVYDFGDDWQHDVLVERAGPLDPAAAVPRCLAGRRACPPEDCGGPWGYADFLRTIADPSHPEHSETLEWVGGSFDPDAFDLEEVNALLARPFRRGR
jgi:hypothetical protein